MLLFRNFKLCSCLIRSNLSQIKPQLTLTSTTRYYNIFTKSKLTSKCDKRSFYNWFRKPSEAEYRYKDRISPEYKLIYNTTFDKYLVLGQIVTAVIGGIAFIVAILTGETFTTVATPNEPQNGPKFDSEFIVFVASLIVCIVIVQRMISIVPVRIYKSPITKEYVFVKRGVLPFSRKYFTCEANQLQKVEDASPIVPWNESTYKLVQGHEQKKLVLLEYCFKRPADLNILLGYQKEDE